MLHCEDLIFILLHSIKCLFKNIFPLGLDYIPLEYLKAPIVPMVTKIKIRFLDFYMQSTKIPQKMELFFLV